MPGRAGASNSPGDMRVLGKMTPLCSPHLIDHCHCVRDAVAMPGDVLVGTNQHELVAIQLIRRLEPRYLERHGARLRRPLERVGAVRGAEVDQREALAERV